MAHSPSIDLADILVLAHREMEKFIRSQAPNYLRSPDDWQTINIRQPGITYEIQYSTNSPTEPVAHAKLYLEGKVILEMNFDLSEHYRQVHI